MRTEAIDENTRAAILRLTQSERECLKRCLSHQTAKQMALELGISPHAVEKRLKMARAKLGLSSSVEAAKLVESLERLDPLGPQSSDLLSGYVRPDNDGSVAAPRTRTAWMTRHRAYVVPGTVLMSVFAAVALVFALQSSGAVEGQASPPATVASAPATQPLPGTEAALRTLVAGLASGSPDYSKLSPVFAEIVRRDLPVTHGAFSALGKLQSLTFRGRDPSGHDVYDLVFANGEVMMSARLDAEGRMDGGLLQPLKLPGR